MSEPAYTLTFPEEHEGQTWYIELGRYGTADEATSAILPGLRIPVGEIFWPR